jgi:hypothetical protein
MTPVTGRDHSNSREVDLYFKAIGKYCAPLFIVSILLHAVFSDGLFKNKDSRSANTFNSRWSVPEQFGGYLHIIYPNELDIKDNPKSVSFHDISNRGRLKTKLYDKRDGFIFLKVNSPFIIRNMLAASVYIVYISQLVHVYAILGHVANADTLWKELIRWQTGCYSKPTLFVGGNHCSKMSMVDISQIINPFPFI